MVELAGISARLAQREATVPALRPGCEKRIRWAHKADRQTPVSIVFVHGFSASAGELAPLVDIIADGLGANVFYTRLTGHGQDGAAFGASTYPEWRADVTDAVNIGQTIGERVILIGCSTGCTLISLALGDGARALGVVHISPNYGLANRLGQMILDLPGIRHYGHLIAGREKSFPILSAGHAQFWTTSYPISAVYPMAEAVRAARKINYAALRAPALFALNDADQVISARLVKRVMRKWGGVVTHVPLVQGPEDDKMGHVMAGDVFSPNQTAPLAARILEWAKGL